jgi:hypothetical protein
MSASPQSRKPSKPLGETSARILVAVAAARAKTGQGPTWGQVGKVVGERPNTFVFVSRMQTLRKRGLLAFEDDVPRTTDVTPAGLREALQRVKR